MFSMFLYMARWDNNVQQSLIVYVFLIRLIQALCPQGLFFFQHTHTHYLDLADGLLVLLLSGLKEGLCLINQAAKTSILGVLEEHRQKSHTSCISKCLTQHHSNDLHTALH